MDGTPPGVGQPVSHAPPQSLSTHVEMSPPQMKKRRPRQGNDVPKAVK